MGLKSLENPLVLYANFESMSSPTPTPPTPQPRNRLLSFQHISKWIADLSVLEPLTGIIISKLQWESVACFLQGPTCQALGSYYSSQSRVLSIELSPQSAGVKGSYGNWFWGGKALMWASWWAKSWIAFSLVPFPITPQPFHMEKRFLECSPTPPWKNGFIGRINLGNAAHVTLP